MLPVNIHTPKEIAHLLAGKARELRLMKEWTRDELAARSGISVSSLKRFEQTGQISLERLLKIAMALDALDGFAQLFEKPEAQTLAEFEQRAVTRQRGRRGKKAGPGVS